MNPLVVCIILGLGISFTVWAEPAVPASETAGSSPSAAPGKVDKHHKNTLDQLGTELELNEKQKFKIKSLFKQKKQELKALKEALKEEEPSSPVKAEREQGAKTRTKAGEKPGAKPSKTKK